MKIINKLKQRIAVALFSLGAAFSLGSCDLLPSNNGSFNDFSLVQGFVINKENEGISDVTMILMDINQVEISRSITDTTGLFEFYDVEIGQYELKMILPTTQYIGPNESIYFMVDGSASTCKIGNIKLANAPQYGPLHIKK